jgi:hypothetical protein
MNFENNTATIDGTEELKGKTETQEVIKAPSAIDAKIKEITFEINKLDKEYRGNTTAEHIIDLKAEIITTLEKIKALLAQKYPGTEISQDEKDKIDEEIKTKQGWLEHQKAEITIAEAELAKSK